MSSQVLTLNAGSSSIKFALFDADGAPSRLAIGQVEGIGTAPRLKIRDAAGESVHDKPLPAPADHAASLRAILAWIEAATPDSRVTAVGHRVVHGGVNFVDPVIVTAPILNQLAELNPLAPLHQPHNLAGIAAAMQTFPGVPQIACFDTAFHRTHPFVADTFALPRDFYDSGIRRYGFHGLSYEYIARKLREIAPVEAAGRVIVGHLGNGASLCGLRDGRSAASTMGFTALDGLPMGTRCGQLDPGVVLYLIEERGMSPQAVTDLLYCHSGLKGLSGLSNDMRVLEASDAPRAREAVDYFAYAVRRGIGSLAAALEGLDALVFTGGIGENSANLRKTVLAGLGWLGVVMDEAANLAGAEWISAPESAVKVLVVKTDEEAMIARHAVAAAGLRQAAAE